MPEARRDPPSPVADFSYVAGDSALDFANTLGDRGTDAPNERLRTYEDLVWWAFGAEALPGRVARRLISTASEHPEAARATLDRARRLREAMHRAFAAVSAGTPPPAADLAIVNEELRTALAGLELQPEGSCCALGFRETDAPDRVLWPIARGATNLLTSSRLERVKQCASDTCDWLFVDESRNHSRRWCDMRECGNRAKARRHYARTRKRRPAKG